VQFRREVRVEISGWYLRRHSPQPGKRSSVCLGVVSGEGRVTENVQLEMGSRCSVERARKASREPCSSFTAATGGGLGENRE
jgi:hypothetical protein